MNEADMIRMACENVEAWSAGDWDRLRMAFSPNVVYQELGTQRRFEGIDQLVEDYKSWKQSAPDGTGRVINVFARGNMALVEVVWTGTQTGPLQGPGGTIAPTGKAWSCPAAQVMIFEGDEIVEFRHYFDMMTMLQQLGMTPAMGQPQMAGEPAPSM